MKYCFTVMLILATFLLTGCNNNNGESSQEYLEILQSGTYSLSGNGMYEGVFSMMYQYVDGENFHMRYRNANDSYFRYLYSDGVMYRTLDDLGLYANAEENMPNQNLMSIVMDFDYNSAVYSDSGKKTVQGTTYYYDAYTLKKFSGEESILQIFTLKTGELYAITVPEESIVITVNFLSSEIPDDVYFEIPDDYEEIDYTQMESYSEL